MIKITALNKESEEETRSEEEVTREALEQIALQQYAKALDLQRKGNLSDAMQLLKDLLETELLDAVKKPEQGDKVTEPLFNLKYLSYKNLGSMLSASGADEAAIEAYCAASDLDDSDVTLWHRLGLVCMRAKRYEMALHAFQSGADRNPKHWPCLDKIVTLLFGLDYKEECISVIYDTLQLDPGYMRGLVYRKHIFTTYCYIREFMKYLNPMYKWNENEINDIDEEKAQILLREATEIQDTHLEQQKADQFKYIIPILKLSKPITKLTWESVGNSLVHMHKHITDNYFSHACQIEVLYETEERKEQSEVINAVKEIKVTDYKFEDSAAIPEKSFENGIENDNNEISDKEKTGTDIEKIESDVEIVAAESAADSLPEPKKKPPVRRRGSALSFLEQWEWCNKRRSGRKKPVNRQDRLDDNIYDTLRRMVPLWLIPETIQNKDETNQHSPQMDFTESQIKEENNKEEFEVYFGSDNEQVDVKQFLHKYIETKRDIIDMLKEYLGTLAEKWNLKWPESLSNIYVEANKCYRNHIDIPAPTDDNHEELFHYVVVNLLTEEFSVNAKLNSTGVNKSKHELNVVESIGVSLSLKPHVFAKNNILEFVLRYLWLKVHIHMLNKTEELALDNLYQLLYEFEAMAEHSKSYNLHIVNFTFKPIIREIDIVAYIKFFERNKKLSTVMELYDHGNYEDVLSIIIDSFEHCKDMARKQEEEMSLDFAVQLSLILDTFWALDKVDSCFKWSLICLHEALNHFFRFTSGSSDYKKWTLAVVKVLCCMEHILSNEGLACLETVTQKELGQGLEDLIRIIGHQVETNAAEMPFGTVVPWIIIHYILQREEDHGRGRAANDKDKESCDDMPNPLMILFIAHEQLGNHGWCCNSEGKLLYFILDTVVPRLRSPSLSKPLEQVFQYMEQCVYCLFGHPVRKNKLKHLTDHGVTPHTLDWKRAQQVYEIFRPPTLPALEGKVSGITADTEQLFIRILDLLPADGDPQKYIPEIEKYIKGIENKLPTIPPLLPYKMKDIYFLLGDYYFKKEEGKLAIKYNMLDVIVNNDRLESWAEISLAKAVNLERILNSCKNLNNEREFLNPAKSIIRCFQRSLELDPTHCNMWIEYGMFVYTVHSFCSRLLKQASESLSMEDFEALEKQKEDMLDTTLKCFMAVLCDLNNSEENVKANEDSWLQYYMLGKVAEKRNKPPSEYLNYYMQGVKSLQETDATYPLKINYSSPTHLCIEVLELHYRIHASILKYIEQHENKPIPTTVGKVFANCIEEWKKSPFNKKTKKEGLSESESEPKGKETVLAGNIFKRSISDAGEDDTGESKKIKLEVAAAKVKRSASYDTEILNKDNHPSQKKVKMNSGQSTDASNNKSAENIDSKKQIDGMEKDIFVKNTSELKRVNDKRQSTDKVSSHKTKQKETDKKSESSTSSSSSSSSDSSSSDSSSNSSTETSRDSQVSSKSANNKPLSDEEIMKIVSACLDALEDCASRFPPHYKAIYRLAHYHFYYKKGKNIERCRDLMLSNFTSRCSQKLGGLFSERKHSNFFNNIWKFPHSEVERAGGFAFHMSRSVQLTMEILKEIDDHKTLLDLSLHLQRIPELDKKYLRDSDREELAQQAFCLCVQSLKGQLLKFSQQADLKSNDVERQALKSLMLDIYRAYQRAQKQPNSKQFTNLLTDAYKLVSTTPINENMNLVDLSMKFCQSLIQTLKQQATQASLDKSQNAHKKQTAKAAAAAAVDVTKNATPTTTRPRNDPKAPTASSSSLPKMSAHDMTAAFQNFLPVMNDSELSRQTAAALSYLNNISALAGYSQLQSTLQTSLQNTLQNSFQAEFYRQFISQSLSSYNLPPPKKQKRGPKPTQTKTKSFATPVPPVSKPSSSTAINHNKSASPLTPSMGTVLPSLPASMTANLSSFGGSSHSSLSNSNTHNNLPIQAHMSSTSKVSTNTHPPTKPLLPHQQSSPGKTLQEKLAERQKNLPTISKNSKEINASISKLPSSLTITKSSVPKHSANQTKKIDSKKSVPLNDIGLRPKPISSDEVIVLDDD